MKRNIQIFFRDKMNVFFALLASLIMFVLYTIFLGEMQVENLHETLPGVSDELARNFVNAWVFAGILTITTITTGLAALQVFVSDQASGRFKDFAVAPISKAKIIAAYLASTVVISLSLTAFMLLISQIYIVATGGNWIGAENLAVVCVYLILSCITFSALSSFVATFIKTESAFSSFSVIIGTAAGFVAGVYVPIGALPAVVANVINSLPFSQIASLIREPFTQHAASEIMRGDSKAIASFNESFGMVVEINGKLVSSNLIILIALGITIIFTWFAIKRISRKLT